MKNEIKEAFKWGWAVCGFVAICLALFIAFPLVVGVTLDMFKCFGAC